MDIFIQSVLNGIQIGSIYGLTAVGLTLIFGVLKVVNFAHGSVLMVGMYAAYWLIKITGIHPYPALIIVVPVLFLFGYMTQRIIIQPVLKSERDVREPLTIIVITTGLWYLLDNSALMFFGAEYRVVTTGLTGKTFSIGEMIFSTPKFLGFLATMVSCGVLFWYLKFTRMGMAIRAASLDRDAASLMGIDQYKIYSIAFGIGTGIAGIAGCVLIPFYYVFPTVGVIFDIKCFIIVVLGGLGSIQGALLGGIIIGLIEAVFPQYMASTWTEAITYSIFLLILFFKPSGLFGKKQDW